MATSNKNNLTLQEHTFRTLIIEDHALVRSAVKAILKEYPEFIIIGEAANGKDGIDMARKLKPDIILLDIELPDISGLQVAKRILQAISVKIIALTSQMDEVYLSQLTKLGVAGYLTKTCSPQELVEAMRSVQSKLPYIPLQVAEHISTSFLTQPKKSPLMVLTQRELEILMMICHGEKTAHIAAKLFLSPKTINKHRQNILKKLGVKNEIELAKLALSLGLLKS
jgi:DNA-binding NarL/FixJ family response regulator